MGLVTLQMTKNKMPRWLSEGIAEYAASMPYRNGVFQLGERARILALTLFLPLLLAHQVASIPLLLQVVTAFFCFGLCASSVYILNDMLDLPSDRQHHSKQRRPFAAGDLSLQYGLIMSPVLLAASFALALRLPLEFIVILGVYYFSTCLYSFVLKKIELVDVITLATLYTLRIIAGAAAVSYPEFFSVLDVSLLGKARKSGLIELGVHDLRDFTHDRHRTVDDTPFGGGAGMAPMRSHLFHLFHTLETQRKVTFFYGARSLRENFYMEDFLDIEKKFDNFKYVLALSAPLPEENWEGPKGFIHQVALETYLKDHEDPTEIEYYLCGPPMMIDAVIDMLHELGVEDEMIAFDKF